MHFFFTYPSCFSNDRKFAWDILLPNFLSYFLSPYFVIDGKFAWICSFKPNYSISFSRISFGEVIFFLHDKNILLCFGLKLFIFAWLKMCLCKKRFLQNYISIFFLCPNQNSWCVLIRFELRNVTLHCIFIFALFKLMKYRIKQSNLRMNCPNN